MGRDGWRPGDARRSWLKVLAWVREGDNEDGHLQEAGTFLVRDIEMCLQSHFSIASHDDCNNGPKQSIWCQNSASPTLVVSTQIRRLPSCPPSFVFRWMKLRFWFSRRFICCCFTTKRHLYTSRYCYHYLRQYRHRSCYCCRYFGIMKAGA